MHFVALISFRMFPLQMGLALKIVHEYLIHSIFMRLQKLSLIFTILVWENSLIAEESHQKPAWNSNFSSTFDSTNSEFFNHEKSDSWVIGGNHEVQECISSYQDSCPDGKLFGGIDILFIRPHLSSTYAFARVDQNLGRSDVTGQEFEFDYNSSFRLFAGFRNENDSEYRFTYWHYRGDSWINETAPVDNSFIVDPFGNRGGGSNSGDLIATKTVIETNIYDLEYMKRTSSHCCNWAWNIYGGLRVADINLSYESHLSLFDGRFTGSSDAEIDFLGVGPRLGAEFRRFFGNHRKTSFFVKTNGSLLLGNFDVTTSFEDVIGTIFQETQTKNLMKTIPVFETELGISSQFRESLTFTVGWLFQAWFDMEFLNGDFGGFFDGGNNSNILSFDGLFLRGEFTY